MTGEPGCWQYDKPQYEKRTELEICVEDPAGLEAAQLSCVSRIELCSALDLGGLTPSPGLIRMASASRIPVYVMIRPRPGSFCFTASEEAQMVEDIEAVRAAGLTGVVLGASCNDHRLDLACLERLGARSAGLSRQLHRVFDLVPEPMEALEQAVALGFERILTSGQARQAPLGTSCLAQLVRRASGRIGIMAGGGVRPANAANLIAQTGIDALHASCRLSQPVQDGRLDYFGFAAGYAVTSRSEIIRLHEATGSALAT